MVESPNKDKFFHTRGWSSLCQTTCYNFTTCPAVLQHGKLNQVGSHWEIAYPQRQAPHLKKTPSLMHQYQFHFPREIFLEIRCENFFVLASCRHKFKMRGSGVSRLTVIKNCFSLFALFSNT